MLGFIWLLLASMISGSADVCPANVPVGPTPVSLLQTRSHFKARVEDGSDEGTPKVKTINGDPALARRKLNARNAEKCSGTGAGTKMGVRCCQDGAGKVLMSKYGCKWRDRKCASCKWRTYAQAKAICEAANLRLCTLDEMVGDGTCKGSKSCSTGCDMNNFRFWTSTTCGSSNTKEKAVKEAKKEKVAKETKEKAVKEKAVKEKVAQEAQEKAAKEAKEKVAEAKVKQAVKEKAAQEAKKEKTAKDTKEKAVKEKAVKMAQEAKENAAKKAKEKAAKEKEDNEKKAVKEKAAKDAEKAAKETKEKAVKEKVAKEAEEKAAKEAKEKAAKEAKEKAADKIVDPEDEPLPDESADLPEKSDGPSGEDQTPTKYKTINAGRGNKNPEACTTASEKLAFRCCGSGNEKIYMRKYGCSGACLACKAKTFAEAVQHCEKHGLHLCSLKEVHCRVGSKTCSTGCGLDYKRLWTSTACPQPPPTPPPEEPSPPPPKEPPLTPKRPDLIPTCVEEMKLRVAARDAFASSIRQGPSLVRFLFHDAVDFKNLVPVGPDGKADDDSSVGCEEYVKFDGFKTTSLNAAYRLDKDKVVSSKPTYWVGADGPYLYWCTKSERWNIGLESAWEDIKQGSVCRGPARKTDAQSYTTGSWEEWLNGAMRKSPSVSVTCGVGGQKAPLDNGVDFCVHGKREYAAAGMLNKPYHNDRLHRAVGFVDFLQIASGSHKFQIQNAQSLSCLKAHYANIRNQHCSDADDWSYTISDGTLCVIGVDGKVDNTKCVTAEGQVENIKYADSPHKILIGEETGSLKQGFSSSRVTLSSRASASAWIFDGLWRLKSDRRWVLARNQKTPEKMEIARDCGDQRFAKHTGVGTCMTDQVWRLMPSKSQGQSHWSNTDLSILASNVFLEEFASGPYMKDNSFWGRSDGGCAHVVAEPCTCDRDGTCTGCKWILQNAASKHYDPAHNLGHFKRFGFDAEEMVALLGAHSLGGLGGEDYGGMGGTQDPPYCAQAPQCTEFNCKPNGGWRGKVDINGKSPGGMALPPGWKRLQRTGGIHGRGAPFGAEFFDTTPQQLDSEYFKQLAAYAEHGKRPQKLWRKHVYSATPTGETIPIATTKEQADKKGEGAVKYPYWRTGGLFPTPSFSNVYFKGKEQPDDQSGDVQWHEHGDQCRWLVMTAKNTQGAFGISRRRGTGKLPWRDEPAEPYHSCEEYGSSKHPTFAIEDWEKVCKTFCDETYNPLDPDSLDATQSIPNEYGISVTRKYCYDNHWACKAFGCRTKDLYHSFTCQKMEWCVSFPTDNAFLSPSSATVKSLRKWTELGEHAGRLSTLSSDWALLEDPKTRSIVQTWAADTSSFHKAFAAAFAKLSNVGHKEKDLGKCTPVACELKSAGAFTCGDDGYKFTTGDEHCAPPTNVAGCTLTGGVGARGVISCRGNRRFVCCPDGSKGRPTFPARSGGLMADTKLPGQGTGTKKVIGVGCGQAVSLGEVFTFSECANECAARTGCLHFAFQRQPTKDMARGSQNGKCYFCKSLSGQTTDGGDVFQLTAAIGLCQGATIASSAAAQ